MHPLPTGRVTFLFTDLEGSTRRLEELGDRAFADLMAAHHRVCRDAWRLHRGVEFGTAGDAFFVAFARASDAVAAAEAAQGELRALGFRVRIGLHTGDVTVGETGYVGLDVNLASRIASAANGGQTLLSGVTVAELVAEGHDGALRDLGEHWFRNHRAPERVFQLGTEAYPPLATVVRGSLPVPLTAIVGRVDERAQLSTLLADDEVRLVSVVGPGGIGKTRLALEAARDASSAFPGGVWWVPLASVRDGALVEAAFAKALDAQAHSGVELRELVARCTDGLRSLIVVDNAEHVLGQAADIVVGALTSVPALVVLMTSRERLGASAERVVRVPQLSAADAVALFVERTTAAGARPGSQEAVASLCRRLDDLPLAIELAAARVPAFSVDELLVLLDERLDMLRAGPGTEPRHLSLRATLDWSWSLLAEDERAALERLSVFAGGCSDSAARMVAGADGRMVSALVDKSLLQRTAPADGERRLALLETVRVYAAERLRSDEAEAALLAERHLHWYLDVMERAREAIRTDPARAVDADADIDNVHAALGWALSAGRIELAADLVCASRWYWHSRALGREGIRFGLDVLERSGELEPRVRAHVVHATAELARFAGENDLARGLLEQEIELLQQCGGSELALVGAYESLASLSVVAGDLELGAVHADEAVRLARAFGGGGDVALALSFAGEVAFAAGRYADARDLYAEIDSAFERLGRRRERANAVMMRAECSAKLDDLDAAARLFHVGLGMFVEMGERFWMPVALREIGVVLARLGHAADASLLLGAGARHQRDLGVPDFLPEAAAAARVQLERDLGDRYLELFAAGEELPLDEAAALALDRLCEALPVRAPAEARAHDPS